MAVAIEVRPWTLEELHRLPDDGNKYELIRGELFVTPPPTDEHETILAVLTRVLAPYVHEHRLGLVYHPKSVVRFEGSEVEPDLMVRARHPKRTRTDKDWTTAPIPILVVEVASPFTRRRDRDQKRALYLDAGVAEYWMIDPDQREIRIARAGKPDVVARDTLTWAPTDAEPLTFPVAALFD